VAQNIENLDKSIWQQSKDWHFEIILLGSLAVPSVDAASPASKPTIGNDDRGVDYRED
jgi:hypothetical protein